MLRVTITNASFSYLEKLNLILSSAGSPFIVRKLCIGLRAIKFPKHRKKGLEIINSRSHFHFKDIDVDGPWHTFDGISKNLIRIYKLGIQPVQEHQVYARFRCYAQQPSWIKDDVNAYREEENRNMLESTNSSMFQRDHNLKVGNLSPHYVRFTSNDDSITKRIIHVIKLASKAIRMGGKMLVLYYECRCGPFIVPIVEEIRKLGLIPRIIAYDSEKDNLTELKKNLDKMNDEKQHRLYDYQRISYEDFDGLNDAEVIATNDVKVVNKFSNSINLAISLSMWFERKRNLNSFKDELRIIGDSLSEYGLFVGAGSMVRGKHRNNALHFSDKRMASRLFREVCHAVPKLIEQDRDFLNNLSEDYVSSLKITSKLDIKNVVEKQGLYNENSMEMTAVLIAELMTQRETLGDPVFVERDVLEPSWLGDISKEQNGNKLEHFYRMETPSSLNGNLKECRLQLHHWTSFFHDKRINTNFNPEITSFHDRMAKNFELNELCYGDYFWFLSTSRKGFLDKTMTIFVHGENENTEEVKVTYSKILKEHLPAYLNDIGFNKPYQDVLSGNFIRTNYPWLDDRLIDEIQLTIKNLVCMKLDLNNLALSASENIRHMGFALENENIFCAYEHWNADAVERRKSAIKKGRVFLGYALKFLTHAEDNPKYSMIDCIRSIVIEFDAFESFLK